MKVKTVKDGKYYEVVISQLTPKQKVVLQKILRLIASFPAINLAPSDTRAAAKLLKGVKEVKSA